MGWRYRCLSVGLVYRSVAMALSGELYKDVKESHLRCRLLGCEPDGRV